MERFEKKRYRLGFGSIKGVLLDPSQGPFPGVPSSLKRRPAVRSVPSKGTVY